jgi:hypothetical protein
MDVSDASYYIFNEKEIKVAKWGTPKKYLKKRSNNTTFSNTFLEIKRFPSTFMFICFPIIKVVYLFKRVEKNSIRIG